MENVKATSSSTIVLESCTLLRFTVIKLRLGFSCDSTFVEYLLDLVENVRTEKLSSNDIGEAAKPLPKYRKLLNKDPPVNFEYLGHHFETDDHNKSIERPLELNGDLDGVKPPCKVALKIKHCLICNTKHSLGNCPMQNNELDDFPEFPNDVIEDPEEIVLKDRLPDLNKSDFGNFMEETAITDETLPTDSFYLKIINEEHGPSVFAKKEISEDKEFGPLLGERVIEREIGDCENLKNVWLLVNNEVVEFLSTKNSKKSNWLRHIRPAPEKSQANLLTFVKHNQLYFRVNRDVAANSELLYWSEDFISVWAKKNLSKTYCSGCAVHFTHELYYRKHCILFHDPMHKLTVRKCHCKICGEVLIGTKAIYEHVTAKHDGKGSYQCQFCDKFFIRFNYLEFHRTYCCPKNPNRTRPLCDICGQKFSQPQKLKDHIKRKHLLTEESVKDYKCKLCRKILSSKQGLMRHNREVHLKTNNAFSCEQCGKTFQNKSNLKIHMLTHSGVKPFKCLEKGCSAAFTTKQALKIHYKKMHRLDDDKIPKIERSVAYTFDAYSGKTISEEKNLNKENQPSEAVDELQTSQVTENAEQLSETAASPLSVGCQSDLHPLDRPLEDLDQSQMDSLNVPFKSKGSRKWNGSAFDPGPGFLESNLNGADVELPGAEVLLGARGYNVRSLLREETQEDLNSLEVSDFDCYKYRTGDLCRLREDSWNDNEVQNLCLKQKSMQLDLSYKQYDNFDDLNRDPSAFDNNLLVGDSQTTTPIRGLHGMLSPRSYHPSYEPDSVDLTLPRLVYPNSTMYPIDIASSRFDLQSSRLIDFRSHLGLSPHRYSAPRVGGSSPPPPPPPPPQPYSVYQPSFSSPSTRLSPTSSFHPYSSTYY